MTIENPRRLRAARMARLAQIALVLLAGLAGATLWAHGAEPATPGEQNLRYRHAIYTAIGWNVGHLRAMLEGKEPYDAARVTAAAEHVAALAPLLADAFPADSNLPPASEAKAEVWSHWDDVAHRLEEFRAASTAFATLAAQGDPQAIRPAFADLTRQCKSCHDQYRRAH